MELRKLFSQQSYRLGKSFGKMTLLVFFQITHEDEWDVIGYLSRATQESHNYSVWFADIETDLGH